MAEEWYYTDPQNNVQGPYETASMRQWNEARYFSPDLPIKLKSWQGFHPLGVVFRDGDSAFRPNSATPEPSVAPRGGVEDEAAQRLLAQRLQAEQQQQQQQQQQLQQQQLQQQLQQQQQQQQLLQQREAEQRLEKQRRQQQFEQQQIADQFHSAREQQTQQQQHIGQLQQQQRRQLEYDQQQNAEKERIQLVQRQREFERLQQQKKQQQQQQQQQQMLLQQGRQQGQGGDFNNWDYASSSGRDREREGMMRQEQLQLQRHQQQQQQQQQQGRGGSIQLKNLLGMPHNNSNGHDQWSESQSHQFHDDGQRDERFSHQDGGPDSMFDPRSGVRGLGGMDPGNGVRMPVYAQAPPPLGKNRPDMGGMGMAPNMNMNMNMNMGMNMNLMDWSEAQVATMFNGHVDKQEVRGVVEYCCKQSNPAIIRDTFNSYLGSSNVVRHFSCILFNSILQPVRYRPQLEHALLLCSARLLCCDRL